MHKCQTEHALCFDELVDYIPHSTNETSFLFLSDVVCKALIWNVDINFTTSFESKLENGGIKLLKILHGICDIKAIMQ